MTEETSTDTTAEGPIVLDRGIPGLTELEEFRLERLSEDEQSTFSLLSAVDDDGIALIVTIPWVFFPDYAPDLPEAECVALGLTSPEEAVVFCPVTLDAENETVYVNLMGPFVVNATTRRGRQMVLADSDWPVRAPVLLDLR